MKNLPIVALSQIIAAFADAEASYVRINNLRIVGKILRNAENRIKSYILNDDVRAELRGAFEQGTPYRHGTAVVTLIHGRVMVQKELIAREEVPCPYYTKMTPDLMPAYLAWVKRCVDQSIPLISYECPNCKYPLVTRHAPQFDRWDSTAMCPQCHELYIKITEGDHLTVLRMPS